MASVRKRQKLPPCPTQPMSAGSKTELLLAKAEPGKNVPLVLFSDGYFSS